MKSLPATSSAAPHRAVPEWCRIWVVEDHASVREFLEAFVALLPGYRIVGASENAAPALAAAQQGQIDLVILDLMIPGEGGMTALEKFRGGPAAPKILIYSATVTAHSVQMAIQHGALGYVEKTDPVEELKAALERVRGGGMHYSQRASRVLNTIVQPEAMGERRPGQLELRVLELLARGATMKEVSYRLQISYAKAYRVRQALMERAQIKNPSDLVRYAIEVGVLGTHRD